MYKPLTPKPHDADAISNYMKEFWWLAFVVSCIAWCACLFG